MRGFKIQTMDFARRFHISLFTKPRFKSDLFNFSPRALNLINPSAWGGRSAWEECVWEECVWEECVWEECVCGDLTPLDRKSALKPGSGTGDKRASLTR
jgi:hypothetical protein